MSEPVQFVRFPDGSPGLNVLHLERPMWVGDWFDKGGGDYRRYLIVPDEDGHPSPRSVQVKPERTRANKWFFEGGTIGEHELYGNSIESAEAAKTACEKAIIEAWEAKTR